MKTLFNFLVLVAPLISIGQTSLSHLTPQQIWRRVIQHYDPHESWDQFRGEMHLYTIHPEGGSTEEDLVLDNARAFYQSTLFVNDQIVVKQLDNGAAFFSLNGRTELTEEERDKYQLREESLMQIFQHHQVHFGLPMHLQAVGLTLNAEAGKEVFNGVDCWVLKFSGEVEKAAAAYFKDPIWLYINPEDYSVQGMRYHNQEEGLPASYVIFSDEIEVGGIRAPKIKTYYRAQDDSYWFTDVFYPFTRQEYAGAEAEKAAIRQLLDEETRYFYVRDYENWAKCWSHQEDVFFSFCSKTAYVVKKGWRALSVHMRNFMQDNPDPHLPPIERGDYVFHLQGDLAWVYFNNQEGESAGQHQRVLRKENGVWKMVNMTGIDEASYQER